MTSNLVLLLTTDGSTASRGKSTKPSKVRIQESVIVLKIKGPKLTDNGLEMISALSQLKELAVVRAPNVTGSFLTAMPNLSTLHLEECSLNVLYLDSLAAPPRADGAIVDAPPAFALPRARGHGHRSATRA